MTGDEVQLDVRAIDDAGAPLASVWIEAKPQGFSLDRVVPCPDSRTDTQLQNDALRLRTGPDGSACVRIASAPERGSWELRFPGDSLHGATEAAAAFNRADPARARVNLRFDSPPASFGAGTTALGLRAMLLDEEGAPLRRAGLDVRLDDEGGKTVATSRTDESGSLEFAVRSELLATPGRRTLRARFDGTGDLAAASASLTLTRQVKARLEVTPVRASVRAGDDVALDVALSTDDGPLAGGVIELQSDGRSLASAAVRDGRARLEFATDRKQRGQATLTARHLPDGDHVVAAPPVSVDLTVLPPSWLSRGWLGLLVAAGASAVYASWQRSRELPPTPRPIPLPVAPGIHVVATPRERGRFRGAVIDAHDGLPLEGIDLLVRRPALHGDGVVARVSSDEAGQFEFDLGGEVVDALVLEASSRLHAPESRTLPSGGRLTVALVTRRRALLDRLVQWYRRAAPVRETPGEPTPADVRIAHRSRPEVERWTTAVERAAYGPDALDPETDASIRENEPR